MHPRFVGRLGLADAVTVANATLGFVAVVAAFVDIGLAARLVLLAAIADGLDGVVARWRGGTPAGPYLDSLADVASFGIAPAILVYVAVSTEWAVSPTEPSTEVAVAIALPALFVGMAVARLGIYTAYDTETEDTLGVPTTLAATIMGAAVLAGMTDPWFLLGVTAAFCYLMVSPITYPDLLTRDALIMGVVHALAVIVPGFYGRTFPYALLTLALAYLVLAPRFYWRGGLPGLRTKGNA